jgi:phenylpyruvate tautomerase PptA (4-oxalocrotonate tautomerase family)
MPSTAVKAPKTQAQADNSAALLSQVTQQTAQCTETTTQVAIELADLQRVAKLWASCLVEGEAAMKLSALGLTH